VVLVEFALVLVPLLLIAFGFLFIGLAMNAKIAGTQATAEGARYIAVSQNPGLTEPSITPKTMQNYIRSRLDTAALRRDAVVCITYPTNPATSTSGKVGDPVKVTMTYTKSLIPLLQDNIHVTNVPVAAQATMRLEALPTTVPAGCT
jgi:Flp pilus assembly protein TadG